MTDLNDLAREFEAEPYHLKKGGGAGVRLIK